MVDTRYASASNNNPPQELRETMDNKEPELPHASRQFDWLRKNQLSLALGVSAASIAVNLATDPFAETMHRLGEAAPWVGTGLVVGEAAWLGGAAMMLTAVGDRFENPFRVERLRTKVSQLAIAAQTHPEFESGLLATTLGSVGSFDTAYIKPALIISGLALMGNALKQEVLAPIEALKKRVPALSERANNSPLFKTGLVMNTVAAVEQSSVAAAGVLIKMPPKSWGLLGLAFSELWATIAVRRSIVRGMHKHRTGEDVQLS